MRKVIFACLLASVCLLGLGAVAAAPTPAPANFAGTWKLDKSKSEMPEQMAGADQTWTVKQDEKQLSVDAMIVVGERTRNQSSTYNLDGTETTAELTGNAPGKATRKAKWMGDGKILELSDVRNINFQGNEVSFTITEHWELADEGKTLTVHRKIDSPQGPLEMKLTFTKA